MSLIRFWRGASRRWARLAAWFFRTRYQLLARLFGLRPEGDGRSPRGTLFVEIDGLGYGHLHKAIQGGYLPHLRRLLERGEYRVHRWRCGLAADTPPVQSGVMYGTSEGIVGFYWWDRRQQRRINGANPNHMRVVQAHLAARAGHPGLLAGGSSYSNIMSGGARWAVLTIAGANPHWFQPGQGLLRALAVLVLNPGKTLRFAFDATWELVQEMEDRALVTVTDRPRITEGAFPLVRLLLNVLAREIVTAGTRVDMLRGVPVIYSCYIGYDIVGHHSGPLSRNALRVLRGIDAAVGRLLETRAWTERAYDVIMLSDHGMSGCQPVAEAFEQDFESWVEAWWRKGGQATPRFSADRRRLHYRRGRPAGSWVGRLAGGVARRSSGWGRTWGRMGAWALELGSAGAIKLGERFLEEEEGDSHAPRVIVISCGPLAQLWVRDVERRLDLSEVEALCPGFTHALIDHPAVDVVIGRQGDEIVVLGRAGKAILRPVSNVGPASRRDGHSAGVNAMAPPAPAAPDGAVVCVEGENPLRVYEEPEVVAQQIAAYAGMDACGDVICFAAAFRPDPLHEATPGATGEQHVYSFEHQLGTHASVGGDQAYPFIVLPADVPFDGDAIVTASDLHYFLAPFVRRDERPGRAPATAGTALAGGPQRATPSGDGSQPATIPMVLSNDLDS